MGFELGSRFNLGGFLILNSSSSPIYYDPDAAAWFSAITAAGGSISTANKAVFNTAFRELKGLIANSSSNPSQLNLWGSIAQAGFLCGVDLGGTGLAGVLPPIKGGITVTNNNFVTSDYGRLSGLGNRSGAAGSNKYINLNRQTNASSVTNSYGAEGNNNKHIYTRVLQWNAKPNSVNQDNQQLLIGSVQPLNSNKGVAVQDKTSAPNPYTGVYFGCFNSTASDVLIDTTSIPTSGPFSFGTARNNSSTADLYDTAKGLLSSQPSNSGTNGAQTYLSGAGTAQGGVNYAVSNFGFYSVGAYLPLNVLDNIIVTCINSLT
jgi:hypothetical protein